MRTIFVCLLLCVLCESQGQTNNDKPDLKKITYVSTYYFGPNAFPVPDILDAKPVEKLLVEIDGDMFKGKRGDVTYDVNFKVRLPLFSRRICLSAWLPLEFWRNSEENIKACHLENIDDRKLMKGNSWGDVYVSTDVQLLSEKKYVPAWSVRVALKTASSYYYYLKRYYDSPGYFFDTSLAKTISISKLGILRNLRFVASTGFLCWQTDNGRQNDAVMYGTQIQFIFAHGFSTACTLGGYSGWEHALRNGSEAHDCPMTIKTDIMWNCKNWNLLARWQYGLRDYPFSQFRIGVGYNVNILKKK